MAAEVLRRNSRAAKPRRQRAHRRAPGEAPTWRCAHWSRLVETTLLLDKITNSAPSPGLNATPALALATPALALASPALTLATLALDSPALALATPALAPLALALAPPALALAMPALALASRARPAGLQYCHHHGDGDGDGDGGGDATLPQGP